MEHFTLSNGLTIPAIGLGTWQSKGVECRNAVTWALEAGYTHIDTAHIYKNHAEVAQGIQDARVNRSSIFITSKLPPYDQGYDAALQCFAKSLQELQTDYIDWYVWSQCNTMHCNAMTVRNVLDYFFN